MSELKEKLIEYGFRSPSLLAKEIKTSKQYAWMIMQRDYPVGPKLCKKISSVIGVPWWEIWEWAHSTKNEDGI